MSVQPPEQCTCRSDLRIFSLQQNSYGSGSPFASFSAFAVN